MAKLGSKQRRGIFSCCKLVPTLPQNQQCDGAGTRIKFAAPTGH